MDLPPGFRLSFEDDPSPQEDDFIGDALGAYNAPFLRDPSYAYFALFVRDASGEVRAGLIGHVYAVWLFIKYPWVHAELRRAGIVSGPVAAPERHGRRLGCHSAWVDPFCSGRRRFTRASVTANSPGSLTRRITSACSSRSH